MENKKAVKQILEGKDALDLIQDSEEIATKQRVYTQYVVEKNTCRPIPPIPPMKLIEALKPGIYNVNSDINGIYYETHRIKTDELLRFSDSRYEETLNEINKFWGLKEQFDKFGMTHKRGIILYGDPGTGKSCLTKMVIEDVIKDGNLVFISSRSSGVLTEGLKCLRDVEPDRKVLVVLEDIDEIVSYNEHAILELFDGDSQTDNVLYLGTTNYLDRLPPRILRTGRFDRKLEIGNPPLEGRKAYLNTKLAEIIEDGRIHQLAEKTKGFNFSQLREFLIGSFCLGDPEDKVIHRIRTGNESYDVIEESKMDQKLNALRESKSSKSKIKQILNS